LDVGEVESGAFWTESLRALKERGPAGVSQSCLTNHEGLKAVIARVLSCPWRAAPCSSSATCSTTAAAISAGWSPPPFASIQRQQSAPGFGADRARDRPARADRPEGLLATRGRRRGPDRLLPCSPQSTGPSSTRPTGSSASTKESCGAPTSSASSPTRPPVIRLAGAPPVRAERLS
jgi:hypothetical protein